MSDKIDWAELPGTRKIGRYLFFFVCAAGVSTFATVICVRIGLPKVIYNSFSSLAGFIAFLALRDMSKQWDWVLHERAKNLKTPEQPSHDD